MTSHTRHTPERSRCEVCDMPTVGDTLCNLHYEESEGNMTGHTPGPWKVTPSKHRRNYQVGDHAIQATHKEGFDQLICSLYVANHSASNGAIDTANARLIAAAPELLEALIQAQAVIGDLVRYGGASLDEIEAYSVIKAAIAKAEGRGI